MELFPKAIAKYRFVNRDPDRKITADMVERIEKEIVAAGRVGLSLSERDWLERKCPYLKEQFLNGLMLSRLNPDYVKVKYKGDDQLHLEVEGPWYDAILWEVPLLAIISEVCMTWEYDRKTPKELMDSIPSTIEEKSKILKDCIYADFGTRRRFSKAVHNRVVDNLDLSSRKNFIGTSNVEFAMWHGLKPIGTMAHEWIQAISGLVGLRHANRFAMELWNEVYQGDLGIALTDTFGTDAFWSDFYGVLARLYDGIRQDSGDPIEFGERAIKEYNARRIDPMNKLVIFSDSLTPEKAAKIQSHFNGRIKTAFGIGTNLTNDFEGHKPMNIVIKLVQINDIPVVKLSDDAGKEIGDPKALEVAKWTFGRDR
jgi:nicotinate phosphoribosyltransferase